MEISAKINFKNLKEQKTFDRNTSEYTQMSEILLSGQWKGYAEELVNQGVSVLYVASDDTFVVRPLNFDTENNIIKESFGNSWNQFDQTLEDEEDLDDEDNLDIEAGNEEIDSAFEDEPEEDEEMEMKQIGEPIEELPQSIEEPLQPETNQTNDNLMQVVTLDDVLSIIKELGLGAQAPVQTDVASMEVADPATLEGGDEALKKAFFQGEGNEILDSEFEALNTNVQSFENHVADTQSYIDVIGGTKAPVEPAICPKPDPKEFGPNGFNRPMSAENTSIQTRGSYNDDGEEIDSLSSSDRFLNGIPGSDESEPDIYGDENPEQILLDDEGDDEMEGPEDEDEILTEDFGDDYDFEANGHPDLHRIAGNLDFTPEEEEDLFYDASDFEPDVEEPIAPLVTKNETMNLSGQQVQIVLTGVMITPVEMNYISEAVAKNGGKLKKIEGVDNQLKIVLESNKKSFTINYIDLPSYKAPQPFSIKGYKFSSLEEALKKINFENNKAGKESEIYKSIMTEGFENREINNWNDSDIFDGLEKVNYVSSWSVVNAGTLNLKNGLNEAQTAITKLGTEPNTLVKSEEGNYYLIKGNLREASKIGTERELYDARNRKNIDRVTVVGLYENNYKGLGEIMYEIKKTSIQLLSWK